MLFPPLLALLLALVPQQVIADPASEARDHAAVPEESKVFPEHAARRDASIEIDGRRVDYTASAGTLVLKEEDGSERAHIFYTAYVRKGMDVEQRPITFIFNGGPGSSSVWLHLGAFGPRRVLMDEEGFPLDPPYKLVDNESSLLDDSDLVFIDPVTTGYSRALPDEDPGDFHGLENDVESVAEFIRLYTTRYGRWSSPKYLCGESYGTTRAAALAAHLGSRHGMYLNGVVLVSSILSFQTARFDSGNDLPYILFLPTYAATAFYHGKLAPERDNLRALLDEVEEFALGDYTLALMRGSKLDEAARAELAARLAAYTGLSEEYIRATNFRINIHRFVKELRRDEHTTVGRLDSRFSGADKDAAGDGNEFDPSYAAIQGPFTATINDYLRRELGYVNDLPYEILTGRVHPWKYGRENQYIDVAERLRRAMAQNPALQVFVANGYYDLATPYFATEYTFDHLSMDPRYSERVHMAYYESGHMMYIRLEDLAGLKADVAAFYERTLAPK